MKLANLVCSALLGASLVSATASHAQIREQKFRFSIQNTMDHPLGLGAQKFADLVNQKSGGKMKVTVYPGGSLGGDVQTLSALQGGTIDLMTRNGRPPRRGLEAVRRVRLPVPVQRRERSRCHRRRPNRAKAAGAAR